MIDFDPLDFPNRRKRSGCVCGTDMPGTCPGPEACPYSGYCDPVDRSLEPVQALEVGEDITRCIHCGGRCQIEGGTPGVSATWREVCIDCGQRYDVEEEPAEPFTSADIERAIEHLLTPPPATPFPRPVYLQYLSDPDTRLRIEVEARAIGGIVQWVGAPPPESHPLLTLFPTLRKDK